MPLGVLMTLIHQLQLKQLPQKDIFSLAGLEVLQVSDNSLSLVMDEVQNDKGKL